MVNISNLNTFFSICSIKSKLNCFYLEYLKILQDFPEELRGDVSMHLHNEILGLPIFDTAPEGCKKLLSNKVNPVVYGLSELGLNI